MCEVSSNFFIIIAAYNDSQNDLEIAPFYYYDQNKINLNVFLTEYTQVMDTILWKLDIGGIEAILKIYPAPIFFTSDRFGLFDPDGTKIELIIEKQNFSIEEITQ
jgi:hypothetical protein